MADNYSHEGTVTKIEGKKVIVTICSASACSSCHAKGACSGMDQTMKNIEVTTNETFKIGEQVIVSISGKNSFFALFLGYLLPIVILISTLIVIHLISANETYMALGALFALALYYSLLFVYKNKISDKFKFVISRKF